MARCPKCGSEYDETRGGCLHCEQPVMEDGVVQHYIEQDPSLHFRREKDANGIFSAALKIAIPLLLIALLFLLYHIFKKDNIVPPRPAVATAPQAAISVPTAEVVTRRPAAVPPPVPPKPKVFDAILSFSEGLGAFSLDGKFGFMDRTGRAVIPNRYDDAWWFNEGFAAVKSGGRWGYIDKTGKTAIDFKFDEALPFADGLAPVLIGGRWGYIDRLGAVAVEPSFDHVWWFSEGRAYVTGASGVLIDKTGKTVFSLELPGDIEAMKKRLAEVKVRGCWKTFAETGKKVFRPGYCYAEGFACITRHSRRGGTSEEKRILYYDYSGKAAIDEAIKSVEDGGGFSDGLAPVKTGGRWGYIDKTGRAAIAPAYEEAKQFNEGLAAVKSGGKWGYIDAAGKTAVEFRFDDAQSFSEDVAAVVSDNAWCYVDKKGVKIINARAEEAAPFFDGMAVVKIAGSWCYIDKNGVKITNVK